MQIWLGKQYLGQRDNLIRGMLILPPSAPFSPPFMYLRKFRVPMQGIDGHSDSRCDLSLRALDVRQLLYQIPVDHNFRPPGLAFWFFLRAHWSVSHEWHAVTSIVMHSSGSSIC